MAGRKSDLTKVDRLEAKFQRGRLGLKSKVAFFEIFEERIRSEAMGFHPERAFFL